jgi:predicted nucleic acid-binding protein
VRFWDSSAVVPLLVEEERTRAALRWLRDDPVLAVWWSTPVECASALARLERDGAPSERVAEAFARLDTVARAWIEIEPHAELRQIARRLLRVHPLRAADALQLAAAWLAAERQPPTLELLTLDDRVRLAAQKEGFAVPPFD